MLKSTKAVENSGGGGGDGEYVPPLYQVPRDEEGFLQSFAVDDEKGIKEFFDKFGFVVIRDVLTKEECEATIDDMFEILHSRCKVDRNDLSTWDNKNWRFSGLFSEGILGSGPALQNRQNPNLHKAFATVLGTPALLVNHDRYGFFRPTVAVGADKQSHPDWKTFDNLHVDMNPWSFIEDKDLEYDNRMLSGLKYRSNIEFIIENNHVGINDPQFFKLNVQGLVNLRDNREEDGGFKIVPGFRHHLEEWAKNRTALRRRYGVRETFVVLDEKDPIQKHAIRVTARAGSAVIWDQRTLHGSRPNNSPNPRFAQFFKMFPVLPQDTDRAKFRAAKIAEKMKECGFTPSELGRKMFGLQDY